MFAWALLVENSSTFTCIFFIRTDLNFQLDHPCLQPLQNTIHWLYFFLIRRSIINPLLTPCWAFQTIPTPFFVEKVTLFLHRIQSIQLSSRIFIPRNKWNSFCWIGSSGSNTYFQNFLLSQYFTNALIGWNASINDVLLNL